MAQDPYAEALARRKQKATAPVDPYAEALARRKQGAPVAAEATAVSEQPYVPTQRLRAAAQGAFLGLSDEAEALVRSALSGRGGETYAQAKQDIAEKLAAYREDRPKEALAIELAGGVATGLVGGARALGATAGRAGLREALKAGAKTALASNVGQGAISGYGAGEGGALSGERIKGAAIGGTVGAALPFVASKAASKVARYVSPTAAGQAASTAYGQAQRFVADRLPTTGRMAFLGRAIEPTDITRIQREAASTLPGALDGPTAQSLDVGIPAARAAEGQARAAQEAAKERVRVATLEVTKAKEAQRAAVSAAKTEGRTTLTEAQKTARAVTERGMSRAERLAEAAGEAKGILPEVKAQELEKTLAVREQAAATKAAGLSRAEALKQAGKEAASTASQLEREASDAAKRALAEGKEAAKAAAEDVVARANAEAGQTIQGLRGQQPRGTAKKLQETIRDNQLAEGAESYKLVRQIGAPPEPDIQLHLEIINDPSVRKLWDDVTRELMDEARGLPAGEGPSFRSLRIGDEDINEVTLEGMDRLRRRLVDSQFRKDPNVVGLSASQRNAILKKADNFEERFLAGYGDDAAAEALRNFRGPYRQKFQLLGGLRSGLNLGTVTAGKASGILKQSTRELDEVIETRAGYSEEVKAAFDVGAREWADRLFQNSPDKALDFVKTRLNTEAKRRRLALAIGDEAVERLRQFAPEVLAGKETAAKQAAQAEASALATQLTQRGQKAVTPFVEKATRAQSLAERSISQGKERAASALQQRELEATQRIGETAASAQQRIDRLKSLGSRAKEQSKEKAEQLVEQGRTAAMDRLRQAQEASRAPLASARSAQEAAATEASKLAQDLSQARIARATASKSSLKNVETALGKSESAAKFLQETLPNMSPKQQQEAVAVFGSQLQRQIKDMADAGMDPQDIIKRINVLQKNEVVKRLFGPQMTNYVQQLYPTIGTRLPKALQTSTAGLLGRQFGGGR
jgi:chemotaxis protein histidine kinase CheA